MKNSSSSNQIIWVICGVVLALALVLGMMVKEVTVVFVSVMMPVVIFLATYFLVVGIKRKISYNLAQSFGPKVVQIADAIIEYFEVPLTIILAVSLTLFIIAISAMVILLPQLLRVSNI